VHHHHLNYDTNLLKRSTLNISRSLLHTYRPSF